MHSIRFLLLSLLLIQAALFSDSCVISEERPSFAAKARIKMLEHSDQLLGALIRHKNTNYALLDPLQRRVYANSVEPLISFSQDYGYFSPIHPLISHVSKGQEDIELFFCLFKELSLISAQNDFLTFAIAELLAKGLAYRDLQEGQRIKIPTLRGSIFRLETFTVDQVFNLWNGMPAFGLMPDANGIASILLFRGTDLAIYTKRGWSSVVRTSISAGRGFPYLWNREKRFMNGWSVRQQRTEKPLFLDAAWGAVWQHTPIFMKMHC